MSTSTLRLVLALTTATLVSGTAVAQRQFAELTSSRMPHLRGEGRAVATADIDGDGDRDLVIANSQITSGSQNFLYLNTGKGRFVDATATRLPVGAHRTSDLALGDIDGDGDVDLVTANTYQNRLYLNDGTGVFQEATLGRLPKDTTDCIAMVMRDLDNDGDLDLVFAAYGQNLLYLNNGSGVFTDVTATHMVASSTTHWDVDAADIDGDGDLDLVFAAQSGNRLLLNDGTAHFTDVTAGRLPTIASTGLAATFGDVDGDGDADLICGYWQLAPVLFLNNGSGTFTNATAGRLTTKMVSIGSVTFGDVDGDNDLDVVVSGWFGQDTPSLEIHLNNGSGAFADATATHLLTRATTYVGGTVLADLDGDGDLDLATAELAQRDRLLINEGNGTFVDVTPSRLYALSDVPAAAVLADLDGDGDKDLVFANVYFEYQSWPNRLHRNDGRGNFTDVTRTNLPADNDESRAVACADVDRDGDLDLVFGNFGGQNKLYLNNGKAVFTDATAAWLPATIDQTTSIALGDVNGDG
ncbi:MAG: VCBS repeat-containing protein, partial [Planctomycetes bacterium]|nr:VCBS repeat-containing protein [Planctomycetota bacterium]